MGLFRPYKRDAEPEVVEPEQTGETAPGRHRKDHPTPTRRQAEAARRERLNPTLTKKEARQRNTQLNRQNRLAAMAERDNTPEKSLLRDHIDARRSVGEFLLPGLLVILALTFLQGVWRPATLISMVLMYTYLIVVIIDIALMWRGYKKVHAERIPDTPLRGLMLYGANRCIQMRRLRMPPPRIDRGDAY